MATRVENLSKKSFDQISVHSLSHLSVNHPLWWNLNGNQFPQTSSKNVSLKMESPPQLHHDKNHVELQPPDQESSSAPSMRQPHHEVGFMGGTTSQCNSSESASQDELCVKAAEVQMKPVFLFSNPDTSPSLSHYNNSVACAGYPYTDTYPGGLFTPYGQHVLIQPQMGPQIVGTAHARIPLPFDLSVDGAIYVNAKQYHGILRRRQSRAKLEAQNKLVKSRKPYLHESRHLHALNRVRGSGGRFLSTKKTQQADSTSSTRAQCISDSVDSPQKNNASEFGSHFSGAVEYVSSSTTCSDITSVSNTFQPSEHRFSGISAHVGGGVDTSRGVMFSGGTQHRASVVR